MGQVHENIVNDEKLNSFGRLFSPFYQNMRQKLEWNVEFIFPESPTTNVMFIVEGKEGVKKAKYREENKNHLHLFYVEIYS